MGNEEFMVLVLKRFDSIDENLIKMNERFDNIEKRLDSLEARFENVGKRLDSLEARFDNIEKRLDDMEYISKATYDQTLKNTEQLSKYDYHFRRMDKKLESLNDRLLERDADVKLLLETTGLDKMM